MNRPNRIAVIVKSAVWVAGSISLAVSTPARAADAKAVVAGPAGGSGLVRPIVKKDLPKEILSIQINVDRMADQVARTQLDPGKDSAEQMFKGAISESHHRQEIGDMRDRFSLCMWQMKNDIQAKEDSGKATPEDKADFAKWAKHSDEVLTLMTDLHTNATMIATATRQKSIIDGWERHKQLLGQLQAKVKECPDLFASVAKRCANPAAAPAAETKAAPKLEINGKK